MGASFGDHAQGQDLRGQDLREQIDELRMFQQIDQELGATLDLTRVLTLTMDWALRRTGAAAGMYCTLTTDGSGLIPEVTLGYPPEALPFSTEHPLPLSKGVAGQAAQTKTIQVVISDAEAVEQRPLLPGGRAEIALPLELRGSLLGILMLHSTTTDSFTPTNVAFLERLAGRAAIALDHARLYREAERQADEMAALFAASRLITASLERDAALANAAQSIATVLRVSSSLILDFRPLVNQLVITAAYRLPTARATDSLPPIGEIIELENIPEYQVVVKNQRPLALTITDGRLSAGLKAFMILRRYKAILLAPLIVVSGAQTINADVIGVIVAGEGRTERVFTPDELQIGEALSSLIASSLRQVKLYADVRELEGIKTQMIKMASHDLRNPLGNVMGYFDLLTRLTRPRLSADEVTFVGYIDRSLQQMKALLEDLLELERIESERGVSWVNVDLAALLDDIILEQSSSALLKKHTLTVKKEPGAFNAFGSKRQIRQAIANLISNAIKYTPDTGVITVRMYAQNKRLIVEVQDNGYGISKERQARLFQSFYRAHEPGTEHITGTGLGLSLVKSVIEQHGGEVGVTSEAGVGSTFTLWLPLAAALRAKSG